MPVRPSKEPDNVSLSQNGETADSQGQDAEMCDDDQVSGHNIPAVARDSEVGTENGSADEDENEQVEEEDKEGRVAIGRKSPKDPTKKER